MQDMQSHQTLTTFSSSVTMFMADSKSPFLYSFGHISEGCSWHFMGILLQYVDGILATQAPITTYKDRANHDSKKRLLKCLLGRNYGQILESFQSVKTLALYPSSGDLQKKK